MTFISIFSMYENNIVSIFPYDRETFIVIYQDTVGNCKQINIENINDEKERKKETVYSKDGEKLR